MPGPRRVPRSRDAVTLFASDGTSTGTRMRIELQLGVPLPRPRTLASELAQHFALRDIATAAGPSRIFLRCPATGAPDVSVVYHPPQGNLVVDEVLVVPGYAGATASLSQTAI